MIVQIDTDQQTLSVTENDQYTSYPLYSSAAFERLSGLWLKVGWDQKHSYTFTWMGRPLIQLPEDILRIQEVIYLTKPDVIVETGVAHGGSLIFYASLFEAMNTDGKVIGVDIEIRPHNRHAIEKHPLFKRIDLIEGDSAAPEIVSSVRELIPEGARVLVILDSNHTHDHVLAELNAYHSFVTEGSYIIATDGLMGDVADTPRGEPEWATDNPAAASEAFAASHPEFVLEQPEWLFNESTLSQNITHWPNAYLRRKTG